jgi:hypothetical protein
VPAWPPADLWRKLRHTAALSHCSRQAGLRSAADANHHPCRDARRPQREREPSSGVSAGFITPISWARRYGRSGDKERPIGCALMPNCGRRGSACLFVVLHAAGGVNDRHLSRVIQIEGLPAEYLHRSEGSRHRLSSADQPVRRGLTAIRCRRSRAAPAAVCPRRDHGTRASRSGIPGRAARLACVCHGSAAGLRADAPARLSAPGMGLLTRAGHGRRRRRRRPRCGWPRARLDPGRCCRRRYCIHGTRRHAGRPS